MIRSSGVRISPTEVEEVFSQSGMLREAAVIGVPDGALCHVIKGYVAPREGEAVTPDALLPFCAERVPRYMVPKIVEILAVLPKMPNEKVDYPALRWRERIPRC
jgi:long-chain acyl-CoA synthetase